MRPAGYGVNMSGLQRLRPHPPASDTGDRLDAALAPLLGRVAAAERQRRHRQRLRAGRIQLTLEVDEKLVEALLAVGIVGEKESLDRRHLEAVISEMIDDWSVRALKSVTP